MKISILLPYKENFSKEYAGAVSIFVNGVNKYSKFKNNINVYGNTNYSNLLSKNYINLPFKKRLFQSSSKTYVNNFLINEKKRKSKIIEIHNRPNYLKYFKDIVTSKIIFYFHNDPLSMNGSKTIADRMFILNLCKKIIFNSEWTKDRFFIGIDKFYLHSERTEVICQSTERVSVNLKHKKKIIMFVGKLNKSKGYDLFGKAVIKILDKYPEWKAVVAGNEPREKFDFKHKNLKIYPWLPHNKILKLYKDSSISVVPSKWEEPFGRTSMESAAHGCATITSNRGGLVETFDNDLFLKNLNSSEIYTLINSLIKNPKKLKSIQIKNFKKPLHLIENLTKTLDAIKFNLLEKNINIISSKGPKILHISNFNEKNNQRLFNISIASKLSNGFVRNNCDVINFSYRNYLSKKIFTKLDNDIIEIAKNYKPDMILLGHNNILKRNTLEVFKRDKRKLALWYEDHVANYGPNWISNLTLIEKNNDLIDKYFITTHPSVIKTKISNKKIHFLPVPVDENIENLKIYENKFRYKDLFFALSHGVNFGGLRKQSNDEREIFLKSILEKGKGINFHILGINNDQPKWNYDFYKELSICKMSLNLSRGKPLKYASSNRIAAYMGNGILTFINEKVKFQEIFTNNEMVFYKNEDDLIGKIINLKDDISTINKISKNGRNKYFRIFNNRIVSDSILSKTFERSPKYKYAWEK